MIVALHLQGKPSGQLHFQPLWSSPLAAFLATFQINQDWKTKEQLSVQGHLRILLCGTRISVEQ